MNAFTVTNLLHYCRAGLAALVFATLLAGCDKSEDKESRPEQETPKVKPDVSAKARAALVEWFECEECVDNELEVVLEYQELVKPMLVSVLDQGAAPATRSLYQHQLEQRYDELVEYGERHPGSKPSLPKDEFVALYLGNLDAQYRTRAATALGSIGGKTSIKALEMALDRVDRDDVKRVIQEALEKTD